MYNQLVGKEKEIDMFANALTQLTGTEAERLAQVAELEAKMIPSITSIKTYSKGKLILELTTLNGTV